MFGADSSEKAYFAPFAVFMGVLLLGQMVSSLFDGNAFWAFSHPQYWVQPAQTFVCGAMIIHYWKHYDFRPPTGIGLTSAIGILALVIWVSPQFFWGASPRLVGFEPSFFGADGWPYFANLSVRFLRLVVVVPLVEEVFWRGFLLRWLIRDDFTSVPFGTFRWKSFLLVALCFMLEHQPADYFPAFITGALFNLVAIRTRSLAACVLAHAITNLLLGIYIMRTGQWGFW